MEKHMQRRNFIAGLAATPFVTTRAMAYSAEAYTPARWDELRQLDNPVVLNFRASWSLTCQIKADILAQLMQEEPRYRALPFVEVDWDTFGPSRLTTRLKVKRRSTLVGMRAGREVTRLENLPYERNIRAFLDTMLES